MGKRGPEGKLVVEAGTRDIGPLLGLEEATVKNLPASTCSACGAMILPRDILERVSLAIAGTLLSQASRTSGVVVLPTALVSRSRRSLYSQYWINGPILSRHP